MEPLRISQAIEENILELFAWLYLFPVTLADLLIHPITFLESMTAESTKTEDSRFDKRMPPVLFFLFGTVPLSIAIAKADKDGETMPPLTDAILILALVLAAFPFVWSLAVLVASKHEFGRAAFRAAFRNQCYIFCPPWLSLLAGTQAGLSHMNVLSNIFLLLCIVLIIWGLITEWRSLNKAASLLRRIFCFVGAIGLSVGAYQVIILVAHMTGQKWIAS